MAPKPEPVVQRLPVPAEDKQAVALKTIKEAFKNEYAKTKAADRIALVTTLFETAKGTKNDPVSCYVLWCEARAVAVAAGETDLAVSAVDRLAAEFDVDGLEIKIAVLKKAIALLSSPHENRFAADTILRVTEEAIRRERFDEAAQLLALAGAAARKTASAAFQKEVQTRSQDVAELRKEFDRAQAARATLKADPEDAQASLALGRYLCFARGEWDKGLPLLVAGNDEVLKSLARKDLAQPNTSAVQTEVGDGWWTQAEARPGSGGLPLRRSRAFLLLKSGTTSFREPSHLIHEPDGGVRLAATRSGARGLRAPLRVAAKRGRRGQRHRARVSDVLTSRSS